MKKIKKLIKIILILFVFFFIMTELCIMKYLTEYGYGIQELPQTTLVYFRLSRGFTVGKNESNGNSIFIGRSNYIYDKLFYIKGYYEADRLGLLGYYNKKDKINDNSNTFDFSIYSTNDWCHWFRIYEISDNYSIEDF